MSSPWTLSWRADPVGRDVADRHYNRQSIGAQDFVPPGRCLVLTAPGALWVTSWPYQEFTKHEWAGAWVSSTFRRESGDVLASDLIRAAVAATRWKWPNVPDLGMVSFVNPRLIRHKRDPGRCYRKAGFRLVGETKTERLLVWQLLPADMPDPQEPIGGTLALEAS